MRKYLPAALVVLTAAVNASAAGIAPVRLSVVTEYAPSPLIQPAFQGLASPLGLSPAPLTAAPLGLQPSLIPVATPQPASVIFGPPTKLTAVASGVQDAILAAGDLSKIGTGDARGLGDRVQALLGGGSAASVSEAPAEPVAARAPADALYSRIGAVPLYRYKATFGPRLGVPGDNVITVVGRGKIWTSYPIYGDNFDKDGETIRFVAKLEKTLNAGRVRLADLDLLAKDYNWPSKLDSPHHVAINARKLTRYSAVLKLQPGRNNAFRISIAGPGKTLESASVHWDNIKNQEEAALFVAQLEQALNTGHAKLSDVERLTQDQHWPEKIRTRAYAKIRAEKLTRYQAKLSPWAAVPGDYLLEVTGPMGYLSIGVVRGSAFTGTRDRAAARFVAQLEKALNTGTVTFQDLQALHYDDNWLEKINSTETPWER